mmetsp:Transcript_34474/g.91683  ORF Transcript_34474/g.91683 Transcript_34474/m.91683 type:complete len:344 (+) Transcript_34474:799-1830(+)
MLPSNPGSRRLTWLSAGPPTEGELRSKSCWSSRRCDRPPRTPSTTPPPFSRMPRPRSRRSLRPCAERAPVTEGFASAQTREPRRRHRRRPARWSPERWLLDSRPASVSTAEDFARHGATCARRRRRRPPAHRAPLLPLRRRQRLWRRRPCRLSLRLRPRPRPRGEAPPPAFEGGRGRAWPGVLSRRQGRRLWLWPVQPRALLQAWTPRSQPRRLQQKQKQHRCQRRQRQQERAPGPHLRQRGPRPPAATLRGGRPGANCPTSCCCTKPQCSSLRASRAGSRPSLRPWRPATCASPKRPRLSAPPGARDQRVARAAAHRCSARRKRRMPLQPVSRRRHKARPRR